MLENENSLPHLPFYPFLLDYETNLHRSCIESSNHPQSIITAILAASGVDKQPTGESLSGYGRLHVQYKPRKLSSYLFSILTESLF